MKSQIIEIDGIGDVLFERSKRAKYVNISIKPFRGVRVAVPNRVSFAAALEFVYRRKTWILKHLKKMKLAEEKNSRTEIVIKDTEAAQLKIKKRLLELSMLNGFSYNRVTVRNQKTRWGSCSARKNISLNIRLAVLPAELMDYVILHELVHTKVSNHSKVFWAELDKYVGSAKAMDEKLKKYLIS